MIGYLLLVTYLIKRYDRLFIVGWLIGSGKYLLHILGRKQVQQHKMRQEWNNPGQ